jgi:hypothetical protein
MPAPVLPDSTIVARAALLQQPTLTDLVGARIYYAIPSNPTWPLLVLSLVDDDELRPETLLARVQVDVWGASNTTTDVIACKAIAATVRSVARDLRGTWSWTLPSPGAATVSNAVAGQIIPNPDTTSGRARFITDLELHLQ